MDGWGCSTEYGKSQINAINDPSGGSAQLPITSVPTPFANFELVRNAYQMMLQEFSTTSSMEGNTIYHKLVSYSLDVLEILFNFSKYKEDYELIPWDLTKDLDELRNSSNPAHRALGGTFYLYLSQDQGTFNFDKLQTIYILNYKKGPKPLNVVGGTSPTSLCVASTNDLSYVNTYLSNNHKAFGNDYLSLAGRADAFMKYMWAMSQISYPNPLSGECVSFNTLFPEVQAYIQKCYEILPDQNLKAILRDTINSSSYEKSYIPVISGQTQYFIGQIPMLEQRGQAEGISNISDFRIKTDKITGNIPLALPNMIYGRQGMIYTTGYWNAQNKAPMIDSNPIEERNLPFDGTKYPYLVADDIFQPYLLKLVYPVNPSKFFTAHLNSKKFSYLIPLKRNIFKYFDADFIFGNTTDNYGEPIFKMETQSNSVKVTLKIPIQQGEYITYERLYVDMDEPNLAKNEGAIRECRFDLFIYPFFHTANHLNGPQRIYLIEDDNKSLTQKYDYSVRAYQSYDKEVKLKTIVREDKHYNNNAMSTKYFLGEEEYDYIEISNGYAEALILPMWHVYQSQGKAFNFAVDFGTTNTHIEYMSTSDNNSKPLEYSFAESIVGSLHDKENNDVEKIFAQETIFAFMDRIKQEFLPLDLGDKSIKFPLRTNLCVLRTLRKEGYAISPLSDVSIGFHYEKEETALHNESITNLKWEGGGDTVYVSAYLQELLFMIRAKIIASGGDLDKTTLTWFYPVSMLRFQRNQLEGKWVKLVDEIISKQATATGYTESVAPYFYYKNKEGVTSSRRPVASIDIGGGTTDIVVYENNQPVIISSSRFAGNNLYGDFAGMNINLNGFINRYGNGIEGSLSSEIKSCYDNIFGKGSSADLVSFMYSLHDNQKLQSHNISVNFADMLSGDYQMKVVMLLFYAAEVYHLAEIMKAKNIGTPKYLTVSGTASKMLRIISAKNEPLEDMATIIFNHVIGDDGRVEMKTVSFPKEITCKGGLNIKPEDLNMDVEKIKFNVNGSRTFDNGSKEFSQITAEVEGEVIKSYKDFISFFFSMEKYGDFKFNNLFGIDNRNFTEYKRILTENAEEDLSTVLETRKKELKEKDSEINDSLFFYPLSGGINRLAYYISQN